MKRLLLLLPLLAGCAHISGERTPDGTLKLTTTRFLWSSQNVQFSLTDGTNMVVTLKASKSNSDSEALGAIAEGVARGLK